MFIIKNNLDAFLQFVSQVYGVRVKKHDEPRRGEYARFMYGESIVTIREHQIEPSEDAATLDVFCSNTHVLEDMQKAWLALVHEESVDEESNNEG